MQEPSTLFVFFCFFINFCNLIFFGAGHGSSGLVGRSRDGLAPTSGATLSAVQAGGGEIVLAGRWRRILRKLSPNVAGTLFGRRGRWPCLGKASAPAGPLSQDSEAVCTRRNFVVSVIANLLAKTIIIPQLHIALGGGHRLNGGRVRRLNLAASPLISGTEAPRCLYVGNCGNLCPNAWDCRNHRRLTAWGPLNVPDV